MGEREWQKDSGGAADGMWLSAVHTGVALSLQPWTEQALRAE